VRHSATRCHRNDGNLRPRQHDVAVTGFGDLYPQIFLRRNNGVHNWMTYLTGDIPVGAYDSMRLSNVGIGHGAIDAGGGYTYLNPDTGHEFSAVLGFTYNFLDHSTQYQNGVDMHLDGGASQFLSKQVLVGLVGYVYKEIGCDSGSGDHVGCFQSQVVGVGPQMGFILPLGDNLQGYLNVKGYKEFANEHRPDGWNVWATFVVSPAAAPRLRSHRGRCLRNSLVKRCADQGWPPRIPSVRSGGKV
jgi:hypothetical protein